MKWVCILPLCDSIFTRHGTMEYNLMDFISRKDILHPNDDFVIG